MVVYCKALLLHCYCYFMMFKVLDLKVIYLYIDHKAEIKDFSSSYFMISCLCLITVCIVTVTVF